MEKFIYIFYTFPQFDEKTVQKVISETSKGTKKKKAAKSKTRATSMADVVQEVSKRKGKNKKILGENWEADFMTIYWIDYIGSGKHK